MDFNLTKEQQFIQKAAREFAKGEFTDVARDLDINEAYPAEIVKKARELDLMGLFIPEEYGGPGLGYLEQAMVLEEFWKIDPVTGVMTDRIDVTAGPDDHVLGSSGDDDTACIAVSQITGVKPPIIGEGFPFCFVVFIDNPWATHLELTVILAIIVQDFTILRDNTHINKGQRSPCF